MCTHPPIGLEPGSPLSWSDDLGLDQRFETSGGGIVDAVTREAGDTGRGVATVLGGGRVAGTTTADSSSIRYSSSPLRRDYYRTTSTSDFRGH